jgi:hypothetical protein
MGRFLQLTGKYFGGEIPVFAQASLRQDQVREKSAGALVQCDKKSEGFGVAELGVKTCKPAREAILRTIF